MSKSTMKKQRTLNNKEALLYSLASFGLMLPVSLWNGFSFYYMTYTIGLEAAFVSVGNIIGLVLNALIAPIFGYLSDQMEPSNLGRRRPFMLWFTPVMCVSFIFLWFFPGWLNIGSIGQWGVAIIYWIATIVFCFSSSAVFAPYIAMLPEISTTEENRIKISSMQGVTNLLGTLVGVVFPFVMKGLVSGSELVIWMIIIAIVSSILSGVTVFITFFTIKEPIVAMIQNGEVEVIPDELKPPRKSLKDVFTNMFEPLKNKEFRFWEGSNFMFFMALRIPMTIVLPLIEVVLNVQDEQIILFLAVVIPFALGGFILWNKLSSSDLGLVKSLKIDYVMLMVFLGLCTIFLIPMTTAVKQVLGLILVCSIVLSLIAFYVIPNPLISKIIDLEIADVIEENGPFKSKDDEFKFSGKFFGVNSFILNIGGAIAYFLLGFILSGREEDPFTLTILLPITAVIVGMSYFLLQKMNVKE